jgi:hypothetical protein
MKADQAFNKELISLAVNRKRGVISLSCLFFNTGVSLTYRLLLKNTLSEFNRWVWSYPLFLCHYEIVIPFFIDCYLV